jgi:hypothetical protein
VSGGGGAGGRAGTGGRAGAGGANTGGAGNTAGIGGSGGGTSGAACPKPAGEICHEFYANDNSGNQINYVNEFEPNKNWTVKVDGTTAQSPRQLEIVTNAMGTGGKAVMVSVVDGYQEYDMAAGRRLVTTRISDANPSVRGAARLPNGNTALAIGDAKLRIVTSAGATVSECNLPGSGTDTMRVLYRQPTNGHFFYGRGLDLFEVTESCQQVWTAKFSDASSKAYEVLPRDGGGVFASTGDGSTVVEMNSSGQIVGQVGGKSAHAGLLDFFSGFDRFASGNIVAANWWGHASQPPQAGPHLVEFDRNNRLVWRWGTQTEARQITNALFVR